MQDPHIHYIAMVKSLIKSAGKNYKSILLFFYGIRYGLLLFASIFYFILRGDNCFRGLSVVHCFYEKLTKTNGEI